MAISKGLCHHFANEETEACRGQRALGHSECRAQMQICPTPGPLATAGPHVHVLPLGSRVRWHLTQRGVPSTGDIRATSAAVLGRGCSPLGLSRAGAGRSGSAVQLGWWTSASIRTGPGSALSGGCAESCLPTGPQVTQGQGLATSQLVLVGHQLCAQPRPVLKRGEKGD